MKLNLIYLGVFSLIIINLSSCNHFKSDFKSLAMDTYNDSISKSWKLKEMKNEKATEFQLDYVTIVSVKKPTILNRDFRTNFVDSLIKARKIDLRDTKRMERLWKELHKEKVGPIDKFDAVKYETFNNNKAAIFTDNIFNGCYESEYWIVLSTDNGKSWKKYFTGLTVNKNYYFKNNSKIPLWKNSHILQIEAVKVKKISDRILPIKMEEFQTIRDSIAILLDLSKITLDSDHDGLTDIVEDRMLLNPINPDTDSDGIIDSKDKNPRFKTIKSSKSILYEILMKSYLYYDNDNYQIDLSNLPKIKKNNCDNGRHDLISIFVTDDKEIQGLELKNESLIVMSSKEYEKYRLKYPFSFTTKDYSKMFLCDDEDDVFLIESSGCSSGTTYLIKKNYKGWEVSILEGYNI
jgi:hypothetical protein